MEPGPTFYLEVWEGDILSVFHTSRRSHKEVRNDCLAFREERHVYSALEFPEAYG